MFASSETSIAQVDVIKLRALQYMYKQQSYKRSYHKPYNCD